MLSIKNDALAVGTVATGAAAVSVVQQNKSAIKRVFIKPVFDAAKNLKNAVVSKDTYVKAEKALKDAAKAPFDKKSYKKLGNALTDGLKKATSKESYKNLYKGAKKITVNTGTAIKNAVVNVIKKTSWTKVGKVAGIAAVTAGAALAAKAVYDYFSE